MKLYRKSLSFVLIMTLLLSIVPFAVFNVSAVSDDSGSCGEGVKYTFTASTGALVISGSGAMTNYSTFLEVPWYDYKDYIKSIKVNNGVTNIGCFAFCECSNLQTVEIPNRLTTIGQSAFANCDGLTNVDIPDSVESIEIYGFSSCKNLKSITIGSNTNNIETNVFYNCPSLTSINVSSSNKNYSSKDGVLYDKSKTTLIQYPGGRNGAFIIPDGVTTVGFNAFRKCEKLTSVTIPSSVKNIGMYAFCDCSGLQSATVSNNVTTILDFAFLSCSSLQTVTIYNPSVNIGFRVFDGCSSKLILYGYSGSTTETYAKENGFKFKAISKKESTTSVKNSNTKITVKTTIKTLKAKKLKKKAQSFNIGVSVNSKGKLTYKKLSGNKKITINKAGKITVKKKLKKGTYKVKIKISSGATENYNSGSKTVTVKITVK